MNHVENECSCDVCKNMCKTTPCLGTPEDISKIMLAGYGDKLAMTNWGTGMVVGTNDTFVEMIQPCMTPSGCAYLDEKGLCTLHDLGLKPTEGKLANHSEKPVNDFKETINYKVAMSWVDEHGKNNPQDMVFKAAAKSLIK
jgi:hypothetical protein